jgi:hypothetical protein
MVKEVTLSIPTSYGDISLKKWLEFQKELKNYEDDDDATTALMLSYLCGLDTEYIPNISVADYAMIRNELGKFINNTELPLQRFIMVNGVEYGFEPNLSNMTYGAFADITKFNTITIDDNWAKIMSILYRPIANKVRDTYTIKPYSGDIDHKPFLELGMDIHFGCLFFFVNLSTDLLNSILKSTMQMELPPSIKSILVKNGEHIKQLLNLQMVTSSKLTKW